MPLTKKRVLIVDDSAFMRRFITEIVESRDPFSVVGTACDGADALVKVESLRPDIVTLDIEMPGVGGADRIPAPRLMARAVGDPFAHCRAVA